MSSNFTDKETEVWRDERLLPKVTRLDGPFAVCLRCSLRTEAGGQVF